MAVTPVDLTAAVGGQTSATSSVDTDGALITGPPGCAAIFVRAEHVGTFRGSVGQDVPLDADTWTLAYQQSPTLSSSATVLVKPSSGTTTVYARIV